MQYQMQLKVLIQVNLRRLLQLRLNEVHPHHRRHL
jgi:hypothetical protein